MVRGLLTRTFRPRCVRHWPISRRRLEAANSAVDKLIHVRVYVTDINDWPVFDKLYSEWIGAVRPARAVVPVPTLHYGFRVEIEAVAGVVQ